MVQLSLSFQRNKSFSFGCWFVVGFFSLLFLRLLSIFCKMMRVRHCFCLEWEYFPFQYTYINIIIQIIICVKSFTRNPTKWKFCHPTILASFSKFPRVPIYHKLNTNQKTHKWLYDTFSRINKIYTRNHMQRRKNRREWESQWFVLAHFVSVPSDYFHSSYRAVMTSESTRINRETLDETNENDIHRFWLYFFFFF